MAYGAQAVDSPDVFRGLANQRLDPFPVVTGTAYSSHAPASIWFHPIVLKVPYALSNVYVVKSLNASVPQATSQNSSGSEGYTYGHYVSVFRRQDYSANSTNFVFVGSGVGGITVTVSYSSTAQSFGMSWATATGGGTTAITTTSNAANWSSYMTGAKLFPIPMQTYLSQGEYFFAHQHSSTSATSNSNVTLLSVSNLHLGLPVLSYGVMGSTQASLAGVNLGLGVASAVTTSATMASSVVSVDTAQAWVQYLSNA